MSRRRSTSCHDRILLARHHWQDALGEAAKGKGDRVREFARDAEMYLREAVAACARRK